MSKQKRILVGMLAFASLAGCAPMNTRDYDDRYHRYDRDDYRYDADYRDGPYENRDYDRYDDGRRGDYACAACGVVRRITRISAGRGDNTGSIIIGAVVGGALGNTVGSGDGRRAATVAGAVAGGAVANSLTRHDSRDVVYRIDVQMDRGGVYTFQQYDHEGLSEGSTVEVREDHVYARR